MVQFGFGGAAVASVPDGAKVGTDAIPSGPLAINCSIRSVMILSFLSWIRFS